MPEVKCTVNNCEYWGERNVCTADQILITGATVSPADKDKHGRGAERMEHTPVPISQDTFCWTMTPRKPVEPVAEEEYEEAEASPAWQA